METKIRAMKNPFHEPEDNFNEKIEFKSKIFTLSASDPISRAEYESLIQSMFPFDMNSKKQLNPLGNGITKSWTKTGDLMVHVEWIEYIEDLPTLIKARTNGIVSSIEKEDDGSYNIYIDAIMHEIPAGMPIRVKKQDQILAGQIIAGTSTPKADNMNY